MRQIVRFNLGRRLVELTNSLTWGPHAIEWTIAVLEELGWMISARFVATTNIEMQRAFPYKI